jgi:hypothetical protein
LSSVVCGRRTLAIGYLGILGLGAVLLAGGPALAGDPATALFTPVPDADAARWTPVGPLDGDRNYLDTDWSVTASGAFIEDSASGSRFETKLAPAFTIRRPGDRLNLGLTGNAGLSKTGDGNVALEQLGLRGTSTFEVSPTGTLTSNAAFSMSQEDSNSPDVAASVATTPVEYTGAVDSTYAQKFGRLDFSLKGSLERDLYGPTTLKGGTSLDNTDQNNTQVGGSLRLGFQVTPVFQVFGEAGATRTLFDTASTSLGTKLDGTQYSLLAGVAAAWGDELSASVSAGVGVERFDDASLGDVRAALYDANLTYKPTEVLTLTGDFSSAIAPPGPNGTGTAQINYQATAGAAYLINEWLAARASLDWQNITYAGTANSDNSYGFGVGADYLVNRQTRLSADYTFSRATVTPNPAVDTQTFSLGLTFQK